MRKEDVLSVALKLYSLMLILALFFNYTRVKVFIWSEEIHRGFWAPYNLWILINWSILFFAIYIWYRANKILKVKSSIDFQSGAYLTLGFYWFYVGIYNIHRFVSTTFTYKNKFDTSFTSDLFFEGLGIFIVGGVVLGYWLRRISRI